MRLSQSILLLLFFFLVFFANCENATTLPSASLEQPLIKSINVSPAVVQFTLEDDGYNNTTITINLQTEILLNGSTQVPSYIVTNLSDNSVITSGKLISPEGNAFYEVNFELETSTTIIQNYIVQVYVFDDFGNSNMAEHSIELIGFANIRPEIIEVLNPTEVTIPSGDSQIIVPFAAKVTDADGQSNVDQVFIEFINSDGSILIPNPNTLLDNGKNEDIAANDSIYTIAFTINSNNTPANRKARYFAVDQAGLFSDTLTTTFNIKED